MNILAIDTSNLPLSIAIVSGDKVLGEYTLNVERNHSIRLMPAVRSLMKDVQLRPQDINLFVVARGPGSYTGVRIGVTTAKSLAWSLTKPLVGVSSLLGLAQQIPFFDGWIVPLFDARRDRVYTAAYEWRDGALVEVEVEQILHKQELARLIAESGKAALFLGDDVQRYRAYFAEELGEQACFVNAAYQIPRAAQLAMIGLRLFEQGHTESLAFAPNYLQPTEAEANLGK